MLEFDMYDQATIPTVADYWNQIQADSPLFELIEMAFMYFSHCTAHSYFYSSKYALYTARNLMYY